jgi:hypothetical protein
MRTPKGQQLIRTEQQFILVALCFGHLLMPLPILFHILIRDFGVSECIGSSSIAVGRAESTRKTCTNYFVARGAGIAALSIYV